MSSIGTSYAVKDAHMARKANESDLPPDFGRRVRAAMAYSLAGSVEDFGRQIDRDGMKPATIRTWIEKGRRPDRLKQNAVVERLAEVSGLPPSFFWGRYEAPPLEKRLSAIEEQIRLMRGETLTRAAEVLRRIDDIAPPSAEPRRRQRQ